MIAGAGFRLAGFGELVCWMVGLLGCRAVVMSGGLLAGCWLDGLLAGCFASLLMGWAGWTACSVELALLEFFVSHFSVFLHCQDWRRCGRERSSSFFSK